MSDLDPAPAPVPAGQPAWVAPHLFPGHPFPAGRPVWVENWLTCTTAQAVIVHADHDNAPVWLDVTVRFAATGTVATLPAEAIQLQADPHLTVVAENLEYVRRGGGVVELSHPVPTV